MPKIVWFHYTQTIERRQDAKIEYPSCAYGKPTIIPKKWRASLLVFKTCKLEGEWWDALVNSLLIYQPWLVTIAIEGQVVWQQRSLIYVYARNVCFYHPYKGIPVASQTYLRRCLEQLHCYYRASAKPRDNAPKWFACISKLGSVHQIDLRHARLSPNSMSALVTCIVHVYAYVCPCNSVRFTAHK